MADEIGCDKKSIAPAIQYWINVGPKYGVFVHAKKRNGMPTEYDIEIREIRDTLPENGQGSPKATPPENGSGGETTLPENGSTPHPKTGRVPYPKTGNKEDSKKTKSEPKEKKSRSPSRSSGVVEKEKSNAEVMKGKIAEADLPKAINEVIDAFRVGTQSSIEFGNKAQRSAAEWLLEHHGYETVMFAVRFAVEETGKQYAPTITTPLQLKNKYAELRAHWKRTKHKEESPGIIKI